MDLYFETQSGLTFSIKVDYWDTVLEIKKKIEKYQRIPVSKQTLFFEGKYLEDDLYIEQCKIFHNSRLQVYVGKDQVLRKTKPVMVGNTKNVNSNQVKSLPSNSVKEINKVQDFPVKARINEKVSKMIKFGRKNSNQDLPVTVKMQSPLSNSTKEIINVQDSSNVPKRIKVRSNNNNNDQVLKTQECPPLNTVKDIVSIQESPVKMRRSNNNNTHQVLQTKKSPTSNSNKEINNIPDSPYRMPVDLTRNTIFVLPYFGESNAARKLPVDLNPWAYVKTLRNDLANGGFDLEALTINFKQYELWGPQGDINQGDQAANTVDESSYQNETWGSQGNSTLDDQTDYTIDRSLCMISRKPFEPVRRPFNPLGPVERPYSYLPLSYQLADLGFV